MAKTEMWPCHHCGGEHPIGGPNPCHESATLGDDDYDVTLTSLRYSKQRIQEYPHQDDSIKQQSLRSVERVQEKVRVLREMNHVAHTISLPPNRSPVVRTDGGAF